MSRIIGELLSAYCLHAAGLVAAAVVGSSAYHSLAQPVHAVATALSEGHAPRP